MTILTIAMISGMIAGVAALVLAIRLPKELSTPDQSANFLFGWWLFWTFRFLSPATWHRLPDNLKALAAVAVLGLSLTVTLMAFLLFRFVVSGGSL